MKIFIGKPTSAIPLGSTLTLQITLLNNGGSFTSSITFNLGSSFTLTIPTVNPTTQSFSKQVISFVGNNPTNPQAYITSTIDTLLQQNKIILGNTISNVGITDINSEAFIFSVFGLESQEMYDSNGNAQNDPTKTGLSANVCPMNMNVDMIINFLNYQGNLTALNSISNIQICVSLLIQAVNTLGINGFINFQRGGRTLYQNPTSQQYINQFQLVVYQNGLYNIMRQYVQNPSLFTSGLKAWAQIPAV